jgi:hypothetical protein
MTNVSLSSGLAHSTTPKRFIFLGIPGCTSDTGGWALLREFYELTFALHWQSPDDHVNIRILVLFFVFRKELLSASKDCGKAAFSIR